jgi:hypothetical protein
MAFVDVDSALSILSIVRKDLNPASSNFGSRKVVQVVIVQRITDSVNLGRPCFADY